MKSNLDESVDRAEALKPLVPPGESMPTIAMRFILSNSDVDVVIPGMRKPEHVRANIAASDAGPLPTGLLQELKQHRWDRAVTEWSQ